MYRKYIKFFNIEAIKLEMFKLVKNKVFTISQYTTLLHSGTFYRTKKSCFVAKIWPRKVYKGLEIETSLWFKNVHFSIENL